MFQDTYIKLDRLEVESLVEKTASKLEGVKFDPESTIIMARDLPFYPGYRFLDIADHAQMPPARRFIVMKEEDIVVLDFTNLPIYGLNTKCPILLNAATVKDYILFFFNFVRGRHGRFLIVETVDDIQWKDEPPPAARKSVGKLLSGLVRFVPEPVEGTENDEAIHYHSQMMFRDSLFAADIKVYPDGMVKLSNEQLLIEDMPVLDDVFGQ